MRRPRFAAGTTLVRAAASALALAVVGLGGIAVAAPAQAAPLPDCAAAPTPEMPGRGVVGFFEPPPEKLPAPADPFAPGAKTSIHEQYGYAGLRWNTYDLGCGPDYVRAPDAAVGTSVANWLMSVPKAAVAATGALLDAAYQPTFLNVFDGMIVRVVDALRHAIFDQWVGTVLAAVGFLLVWRSRKMALSSTAAAIGWSFLVMIIATAVFRWPLEAGHAADTAVTSTLSAGTSALTGHSPSQGESTGDQAIASLHESLLYQTWLGGTFGSSNSAVAQKYGRDIFDAQSLTWAEARTVSENPEQGQQIIDAKKAKFARAAEAVKAEDPDAYEYLVGRRSDARVGYAFLSVFAVLCVTPFLLVSSLLVLGALLVTRLGVMLFPAIATLGLFPTMRNLVIGVGNTVAAGIINSIVFGLGTAVLVQIMDVVMSPATGLSPWLSTAVVLVLALVMWFVLKPFRRLTEMVAPGHAFASGPSGIGRVSRGFGRMAGRLAVAAGGSFIGNSAANAVDEDDEPDRRAVRQTQRAEVNAIAAEQLVVVDVDALHEEDTQTTMVPLRRRPAAALSSLGPAPYLPGPPPPAGTDPGTGPGAGQPAEPEPSGPRTFAAGPGGTMRRPEDPAGLVARRAVPGGPPVTEPAGSATRGPGQPVPREVSEPATPAPRPERARNDFADRPFGSPGYGGWDPSIPLPPHDPGPPERPRVTGRPEREAPRDAMSTGRWNPANDWHPDPREPEDLGGRPDDVEGELSWADYWADVPVSEVRVREK
jgi:hypothetical protein